MLIKISRWLKISIYAGLTLVLLYIGGYATLYQVSDYPTLNNQAQNLLANSTRQIQFDPDISHRLLPRPTLILKNVLLTEKDGHTPAFRAKEIRIGIAWSSLFEQPEIEKLVINQPEGQLIRSDTGKWSIRDLWQQSMQSDKPPFKINRLLINEGQLTLKAMGETVQFQHINLATDPSNTGFNYNLTAQANHPQWQTLTLNTTGQAITNKQKMSFPNAVIHFQGKENSYDFSGSLTSNTSWQSNYFEAQHIRLNINSHRFNSTINATANKMDSQNGNTRFNGLNAVYSFQHNNQTYTGLLTAPQAAWFNHIFSSDNLTLSLATLTTNNSKFNLTFNGSGTWQEKEGLNLPNVKITSIQTTPANQALFQSEWEGTFHLNNYHQWNIQARGLFDHQTAELSLARQENTIQGNLSLSKLDLNDYLDYAQNSEFSYPKWPEKDLAINVDIALDTLKLPALEINHLRTHLNANANQAEFKPLSGELYNGSNNGSIRIENTLPPTFHLTQNSEGVQIQPLLQDLFGTSRISGIGQAQFNLHSQGNNRQTLLQNLSGSLKLNVHDGQWLGINFTQLFKSAFNTDIISGHHPIGQGNQQPSTPFSSFQLDSTIQSGISQHQITAQLLSPIAILTSQGQTNFSTGQINDDIIIEGENSHPLPIRISGKIDAPSVTLNYQQITSGSQSLEDKQKAITETLKQQWQWLNQGNK